MERTIQAYITISFIVVTLITGTSNSLANDWRRLQDQHENMVDNHSTMGMLKRRIPVSAVQALKDRMKERIAQRFSMRPVFEAQAARILRGESDPMATSPDTVFSWLLSKPLGHAFLPDGCSAVTSIMKGYAQGWRLPSASVLVNLRDVYQPLRTDINGDQFSWNVHMAPCIAKTHPQYPVDHTSNLEWLVLDVRLGKQPMSLDDWFSALHVPLSKRTRVMTTPLITTDTLAQALLEADFLEELQNEVVMYR